MTMITIRIPTPLRSFTGGADEVAMEGNTVGEILTALGMAHEGLIDRVLTEDGEIRQFVMIYRGSDDVRTLDGLDTVVADGDILSIIPAVAGGR